MCHFYHEIKFELYSNSVYTYRLLYKETMQLLVLS